MNPWEDMLFTHGSWQHRRRFGQMLDFVAARLPELIKVKNYGQDHAGELDELDQNRFKIPSWISDEESWSTFKKQFGRGAETVEDKLIVAGYSAALVDACSCSECKAVRQTRSSPNTPLIPSDSQECLSRIAIAIFEFIWFLSWLDIDDNVRPSSNGLLNLYSSKFNRPHKLRIKYFEKGAFAQVIKLLTGFGAQIVQNPSAVSIQGLCIYRPALEDPNQGVDSQFRTRVVPGQIERHDKIYYQLDSSSNPWLTCKPVEKFGVELTTGVLQMLGTHPLLQVAVEETLENASLNTKLVVVSGGTNSPMHWNSLFRPSIGGSGDGVPCGNLCYFGTTNELFQYILHDSVTQRQCGKFHRSTENHPTWNSHSHRSSPEPWRGRCSVADLSWWTINPNVENDQESPPPSIPHPSEWVLAVFDSDNLDNYTQIIIGSLPLLYCLLAKLIIMGEEPFLLKRDDCVMCIGQPPRNKTIKLNKIRLQYLSKAKATAAGGHGVRVQVQQLELQPHADTVYG